MSYTALPATAVLRPMSGSLVNRWNVGSRNINALSEMETRTPGNSGARVAGAAQHQLASGNDLDSNQYLHSRLMFELWHIHQQLDPMNGERGSLATTYILLPDQKQEQGTIAISVALFSVII